MRKSLAIALLFVFVSLAFFYEAFIKGLIITGPDGILYFYPMLSVVIEQYREGLLPLWNSYMYSGFPLMASSQHGVFYLPYIIPTFFFSQSVAYNIDVALHFALAGFFTYLYARKLTSDAFPAILAGVVFAFMGYMMSHIEHVSVLHTAAWFPLVLYFYEDIRRRAELSSALLASLPFAMQLYAGHPQIYFYCLMVMALYVGFNVIYVQRGRRLRFAVLCALPVVLGVVMASPQLAATSELASFGVRGELNYEFFSEYSLRFNALYTLLFPNLYSGREVYALSVGFLLAPLAFWRMREAGVHVKFWAMVAVLSFVLALGRSIEPLHRLLFHVPLYNGFRGVSKHLIEFSFAVSVLASIGVSGVLSGENRRKLLEVLATGLLLVVAASVTAYAIALPKALHSPALYWPLIVMALCAAAIVIIAKSGRFGLVRYLLVIVVVAQIASLTGRSLPQASMVEGYGADVFPIIEKQKGRAAFFAPDIVAPLSMMRGIRMVDGYDPLILASYRELLGMGKVGGRSVEWEDLLINNQILSMLNVGYVFVPPGYPLSNIVSGRQWEENVGFMRPVPGGDGAPLYRQLNDANNYVLYENLNALPRAYYVKSLSPSADIFETREMLYGMRVNISNTAIVSPEVLKATGPSDFSAGQVSIRSYGHERVILDTEFPAGRGFVVLADQYYPGWRAYIDGTRTDIYRTNGVVRGVVVPQGKHEVTFRYVPVRLFIMMVLAFIAFAGVVISAIVLGRRGRAS